MTTLPRRRRTTLIVSIFAGITMLAATWTSTAQIEYEVPGPENLVVLEAGARARVQTTGGDTLLLRGEPGLDAQIIDTLPDGTRVTVVGGPQEADALTWWQVTTDSGAQGWLAEGVTEPDGAYLQTLVPLCPTGGAPRLAFLGIGPEELYTSDLDGTRVCQITDGGQEIYVFAWNPDGSALLYAAFPDNSLASLVYLIDADGTNERRVFNIAGDIRMPAFAPDGRTLAFVAADLLDRDFDLIVLELDSGEVLVRHEPGRRVTLNAPRWSADGRTVAWREWNADADAERFMAVAIDDGGAPYELSGEASGAVGVLSPDGMYVAKTLSLPPDGAFGLRQAISLFDAATGSSRLLAPPVAASSMTWSWSPDGRSILYVPGRIVGVDMTDAEKVRYTDVYVADVASGVVRNLTDSPDYELCALWSPDGRHIAFLRGDMAGSERGLYVMDFDGQNARLLSKISTGSFTWSPDGKRIYVTPDTIGLYAVDVASGEDTLLLGFVGLQHGIAWQPTGAGGTINQCD